MNDSVTRTIAQELKYRLRWLTIATVALYLCVGGLLVFVWQDAARSNRALCTFRNDLERRVDASREFLMEHPKGIPGIPASTLRNSISNQEQTIRALQELRCD